MARSVKLVKRALAGLTGGLAALGLYKVHEASGLIRSDYHTYKSAAYQFTLFGAMRALGAYARRKFELSTQQYAETQGKLLRELIEKSRSTAFGRDHKFDAILESGRGSDEALVAAYRRNMPLTRYNAYKSYVARMESGEDPVSLTSDEVDLLAATSGTSGTRSLLPTTNRQRRDFFLLGIAVVFDVMMKGFPDSLQLQKTCKLTYMPNHAEAKSGLRIGPNSSSPKDKGFERLLPLYSTPRAGYHIRGDEPAALYVHALHALRDRKLGVLEANFSSIVHTLFACIERNKAELVRDLREGTLSSSIDVPPELRSQIEAGLRPDPRRAQEVSAALSAGPIGLARRLWPDLQLTLAVTTGAFQLYADRLARTYTQNVPVYSPLYGATEGLIAVNTYPHAPVTAYTLVPGAMFFEFIPIEDSHRDQPNTLLGSEVRPGREYELVLTNLSGLFRYRFGDVVRVSGFHNAAPMVEFRYRTGQMLNVRGEKMSETMMNDALKSVFSPTGQADGAVQIVDFTCAEYIVADGGHARRPHYNVFVELERGQLQGGEAECLDAELQKTNPIYKSFRGKGAIGPVQVRQVRKGGFLALRQSQLDGGAAANQLKVPRVLRRDSDVQTLLAWSATS